MIGAASLRPVAVGRQLWIPRAAYMAPTGWHVFAGFTVSALLSANFFRCMS
jgi:hypothetical protein